MNEKRPLVAVIDDDPAVRNSLKFSLELEGFSVTTYRDGTSALVGPDMQQTDCLIIDYKMPDMNGLDLLRRLRALNIGVPAILITTNPSRSLYHMAKLAGVPIVEKPLLGNALNERVRSALRGNGAAAGA